MLKLRLLTSLIVGPLFIAAILFLPPIWFAIFTGLITLGCAWEWSVVSGLKSVQARVGFVAVLFVIMATALSVLFPVLFMREAILCIYLAIILWVLAFFAVLSYARGKSSFGLQHKALKLISGVLMLLAFWYAFNLLQARTVIGFNILLFAFILIWSVDVGAYTVGRLVGRRKLIPRVSPNKTWEGMVGGVLLAVIVSFIFGFFLNWGWHLMFKFALVVLVMALFAVLGDLFESMLKRQAGIKDSGNLLPGHGGLLDRFDSAIAALPVFFLGLVFLGF